MLKKALVIAHEREERYKLLLRDVYGVMFMGTPHRGSDSAFWGSIFGSMANVLTAGSLRTDLLQMLQPKTEFLGNICSEFVERGKSLHIFTVYERLKIKGLPGSGLVLISSLRFMLTLKVVDEHSAVMNLPNEVAIPIEADHRSMCRFGNRNSEKYRMVCDCLKELVDGAMETKLPCMYAV